MLQWQHLPVTVYDYVKWFCLLRHWVWILKDIGAIEVLQLLVLSIHVTISYMTTFGGDLFICKHAHMPNLSRQSHIYYLVIWSSVHLHHTAVCFIPADAWLILSHRTVSYDLFSRVSCDIVSCDIFSYDSVVWYFLIWQCRVIFSHNTVSNDIFS